MEINTSNSLILIVDDKKENLLVLETILKQDDYTVHAASSGIEALSMSIENEYDLFILDVQMPEMNGFELAKHFKGTNRTKDIPIIFLTALSQEEHHIKSGYEVGAVDYLFKPINSTLLKLKVKSFLQIHFQQKALRVGNDILEEKNKELSQFSYIVSHDLKAPLKGIIKLLEWVNEDSPAMSGEYEKKYKEIIDIAINMSTLISGFLNYARDGVDSLETENINMELLLNEAAKSKNSKSLLNFKSKIPEINSYKLLLQIIFKNIFININDSIDPKYKIEIDYSENKSFHHITLELIPFKGDEGVKSTQFTGNNIEFDLSIAYQLIENLKGNLIVVNKDDNQINISIEIPLDIQDAITPIIDKIVSY
ncbi:MAG: response regulator, partial [Cyclobacteriaceae bacterium]|nr:response regulator [Cyclobacteriaceae bacterium]